jgi:hypothetical protein
LPRVDYPAEAAPGYANFDFGESQIKRPPFAKVMRISQYTIATIPGKNKLERIPVMWKRSLHVGSNWRILAD